MQLSGNGDRPWEIYIKGRFEVLLCSGVSRLLKNHYPGKAAGAFIQPTLSWGALRALTTG